MLPVEAKKAVASRFSYFKEKFPNTDANTLAANSVRWYLSSLTNWNTAILKRGDIEALLNRCLLANSYTEAIRLVGSVFSDPMKLGKCFPKAIEDTIQIEDENDDISRLDWNEATNAMSLLSESPPGVVNSLTYALKTLSTELAIYAPRMTRGDGTLRALIIATAYPKNDKITRAQLLKCLTNAQKEIKLSYVTFLVNYWGLENSVRYLIEIIEDSIEYMEREGLSFSFEQVEPVMHMLSFLWENNKQTKKESQLPASLFQIPRLCELAEEDEIFIARDCVTWNSQQNLPGPKTFTACPFVWDTACKAHILQIMAELEQRQRFAQAAGGGEVPFLIIQVRRNSLVDDTMLQLGRFSTKEDLRKPLKVQFVGEEGVDAGGVRKEYFLLMMTQLLDPKFGMFKEIDEKSKILWFNPDSFEANLQFELIGVLFGLAITNRVILDVNFPKVFYKLLLTKEPELDLEDVKDLDPTLYSGLKSLLEFDGDIESTFYRTFQASRESWGTITNYDLIENGSNIFVTNDNRKEYVNRYLNWLLVDSVKHLLAPFRKGFFTVMNESHLKDLLFTSEELELLIVGLKTEMDFHALQEAARYDDGYESDSSTIQAFWSVVHTLTDIEKRKLLRFITGSDRVPIRGLSDIHIVISRNGSDIERLPSSHTCFDHLLLPDYQDEAKLKEKLLIALQHVEGFFTR